MPQGPGSHLEGEEQPHSRGTGGVSSEAGPSPWLLLMVADVGMLVRYFQTRQLFKKSGKLEFTGESSWFLNTGNSFKNV